MAEVIQVIFPFYSNFNPRWYRNSF